METEPTTSETALYYAIATCIAVIICLFFWITNQGMKHHVQIESLQHKLDSIQAKCDTQSVRIGNHYEVCKFEPKFSK